MVTKKGFLLIILWASLFSEASHAQDSAGAGVLIFPTITARNEIGAVAGDVSTTNIQLRLGYLTPSGWYFGMIFSRTTSFGQYSIDESAIGNSVGYFYGMFSTVFSYYLTASSIERSPSRTLTRDDGSGYQFDVSLHFPLGSGFKIGPTVTYRSLYYRKATEDGTVQQYGHSETYIYPYINFIYSF